MSSTHTQMATHISFPYICFESIYIFEIINYISHSLKINIIYKTLNISVFLVYYNVKKIITYNYVLIVFLLTVLMNLMEKLQLI